MRTQGSLVTKANFYILAGTISLSIFLASVLRLQIESTTLYSIRLAQLYAVTSLVFLYTSLVFTPLQVIAQNWRYASVIFCSRKTLGVVAAFFALLHAGISLFGQLHGPSKLGLLPNRFKIALVLSAIALILLLLLAIHSLLVSGGRLQLVVRKIAYIIGMLVIVHAWLIGTHVVYAWVQYTVTIALTLLFLLEAIRLSTSKVVTTKIKTPLQRVAFIVVVTCISLVPLLALPKVVKTHHSSQGVTTSKGSHGH